MKHIWSILCKNTIVNKETNSLSLFDIIEGFVIGQNKQKEEQKDIKTIPFESSLVSYWLKEDNKSKNIELQIEEKDPTNKTLDKLTKKISIPEDKNKIRINIKLTTIQITKPGKYWLNIKIKQNGGYKLIQKIPFDIKFK